MPSTIESCDGPHRSTHAPQAQALQLDALAPSSSVRGCSAALRLLLAACVAPALLGAPQQRRNPSAKWVETLAGSGPDPRNLDPGHLDPRGPDYEPRRGPVEGGDLWTFGKAHAAVHSVQVSTPEGELDVVLAAFEAFSEKYGLSFGLGARGVVLDGAMRNVVASRAVAAVTAGSASAKRGLRVMALDSGLGGRLLHCLPALLSVGGMPGPHELVSLEGDAELSSEGARLLAHALGPAAENVHHVPIVLGEETTLDEALESLRDGYDLPDFDVVLASGSREQQRQQVASLLRARALLPGAMVHGEGPADGEGTELLLEFLRGRPSTVASGRDAGRFNVQVHDAGAGTAAIVATFQGYGDNEEL